MSNWQKAYGWIGHILISNKQGQTNANDNVFAIPDSILKRLFEDYSNLKLKNVPFQVEQLGVLDSDYLFLACGHSFSEGFQDYGTIFQAPRVIQDLWKDEAYLNAFKKRYGVDLPRCHFMIGCSSEH